MVILAVGATVISQMAFAQTAPTSMVQVPPAPQPQAAVPDIRIERRGSVADNGPVGPPVMVTALHIAGATRFPESTLVAVTGFKPGAALTIFDLRRMAGLVSAYYNAHGYVVAQAYVPAQAVTDGAVTIVVIEGHYGAVVLNNKSRLHDGLARDVLAGLKSGDVVEAAPMRRRLLLLSDIPGVEVKSEIVPGDAVGSSDLRVDLANQPLISGSVQVDNDGDPYTGRYRGGGTLNLNDPLGIGDQATVRYLTSGQGLQFGRASYQAQIANVTLGAAYEDFRYDLGRQYGAADLDGSEQIVSVYASYPLIRSDRDTVRLRADFDYRWLTNNRAAPALEGDRRAEVGSLAIIGDHYDSLGGGGADAYSITATAGALDIQSPLALAADRATSRTQGSYGVIRGSVDRLQNVGGPFQIYAWVRGQAASRNLDIDEKMELGGAYAVRAYPEGEAYGDEGVVGTLEARMWLPKPWRRMPGRLQLAVFEDAGFVRFAVRPWLPGADHATRAGAGVGLAWAKPGNFLLQLSYAHRTGTPPATSIRESSGEFRFEAVKFF